MTRRIWQADLVSWVHKYFKTYGYHRCPKHFGWTLVKSTVLMPTQQVAPYPCFQYSTYGFAPQNQFIDSQEYIRLVHSKLILLIGAWNSIFKYFFININFSPNKPYTQWPPVYVQTKFWQQKWYLYFWNPCDLRTPNLLWKKLFFGTTISTFTTSEQVGFEPTIFG